MKKIIFNLISVIIIASALVGCSDDDGVNNTVPIISSFSPIEGSSTDRVTITGGNFGASRSDVDGHVYFNGLEAADYISWSDSVIIATVPTGLVTGHISVCCGGHTVLTTSSFSYKNNKEEDDDESYESGTFSKYLFCSDVVEFTGKCNPCDYVGSNGTGTALGQMAKDPAYKGDATAGSFALWDALPGDYTIFKVDIEKPGRYYVSFKTATAIAQSFVNVMISQDLESLRDATSYDTKFSRDIEVTKWNIYAGPVEMGSFLLKTAGTYYVRFLMLNANVDATAVATLSLINIYN